MQKPVIKQTENIRRHLGESLTIRWGTSRGRDTCGYTTCSLRNQRGERVAACNGGGYDMRGTVIGNWIASTFPNELRAIRLEDMPRHSHWKRAKEPRRICRNPETSCLLQDDPWLAHDVFSCPRCSTATDVDWHDGKTVDDGHSFYGLRFYDPNFDVLDAKLERCDDTFTKAEDVGKTFRQLQKEGKIVDLDILRGWYKQTSPCATERHIRPTIDGACGESSVLSILNAIGLYLEKVHGSSKLDIYVIREFNPVPEATVEEIAALQEIQ